MQLTLIEVDRILVLNPPSKLVTPISVGQEFVTIDSTNTLANQLNHDCGIDYQAGVLCAGSVSKTGPLCITSCREGLDGAQGSI